MGSTYRPPGKNQELSPFDTTSKEFDEGEENTHVQYRRLGKSGLQVSVPIFGAMSLGSSKYMDWITDEEEGIKVLKAAYDRGLNTWDTSNNYSNGHSEIICGKAIRQHNIPRQKVILMTKCYGVVGEQVELRPIVNRNRYTKHKDYVNQYGLSRASLFNNVEASLKRLQTDYIDLLQIHRFDAETPIEETMQALHDLVRSGKVRYIGASSMWTYQFVMMQSVAEKHGWTKFVSMQNQYSLLYREEEREMNKYCDLTGVGLVPWSPLAGGLLARGLEEQGKTSRSKLYTLTEVDKVIIGRVEEIAKKKEWKIPYVGIAWINDKCASPIVGIGSLERLDDAIAAASAALEKPLTEEEIKYLEEPYVPKKINGHS